jgi:hypothetical protein
VVYCYCFAGGNLPLVVNRVCFFPVYDSIEDFVQLVHQAGGEDLPDMDGGAELHANKLTCEGLDELIIEDSNADSNLRDNFRFNTIWPRRTMVALIFCRMLVGSGVTHAISHVYVLIRLVI